MQSPDGSRPISVGQFLSGDSVGGQILNMFDMDSRPTLQTVSWRYGESADDDIPTGVSSLESVDSNADSAKVDVWVWPFSIYVSHLMACVPKRYIQRKKLIHNLKLELYRCQIL